MEKGAMEIRPPSKRKQKNLLREPERDLPLASGMHYISRSLFLVIFVFF